MEQAPAHRTSDTSALAFADVTFAYGREPAVAAVSLRIAPGEMVALLGPNGAGKSTLLRLGAGVLAPRAGSVFVGGDEVRHLSRREMARRVAVLPQDFAVQFAYTVRQVVEMGRLPYGDIWGVLRDDDRAAVVAALATTDTAHLADRVYNELSGGERQRVLIALALAQASPVLLLDEPTAHLDIKHQVEALELLRRLNRERGLTILAVLHDLNLAARYFPRLILFRRTVLADGPPARVLDSALLAQVYDTPVQVGILRGEEHLSVLPPAMAVAPARLDSVAAGAGEPPVCAHVVAGGGSGALLMRALADAGVSFTAGPLALGDSDQALAGRLARTCIVEPPATPISAAGLRSARDAMAAAAVVILCPLPLGPGNVELLETTLAAQARGARVVLFEPAGVARQVQGADTPDELVRRVQTRDLSGRGPALYAALLAGGARIATTPAGVLALIEAEAATRPVS